MIKNHVSHKFSVLALSEPFHQLYFSSQVQKYVVLGMTHNSQLTLLIEARVKCSERERRYFARVNSNCSRASVAKTCLAVERNYFLLDLKCLLLHLFFEIQHYSI